MSGQLGQREEVVEPGDTEPPDPLEQHVEQVAGGEGVVERAVTGTVGESESVGERAEPTVRHLVAHQPPRQCHRVDAAVDQPGSSVTDERSVEEGHVEAHVVADDDRIADELEERRAAPRRCGVRAAPSPG
jgi:hypothetical protein